MSNGENIMANIKDVAKLAGVSHGTVSNVLKGIPTVSLENVRKVENAVEQLGYRPNSSAKLLKSDISHTVSVVLPNILDSLYAQLYSSISNHLRSRGYDAALYLTHEVPDEEIRVLETIRGLRSAGIIIATCQPQNTALFQSLQEDNIPTIFIERKVKDLDANFFGFRNDKSMLTLVSNLIDHNMRNVALIGGPDIYYSEQLCARGYSNAFKNHGLIPEPGNIRFTDGGNADGFKAVAQLFSGNNPPQAIICTSTQLASGALGALEYVTSDNAPLMFTLCEDSWNDKRFTGVKRIPRATEQMSRVVVDTLFENIENPKFFEHRDSLLDNIKKSGIRNLCTLSESSKPSPITVAMVEGEMSEGLRSFLPEFRRISGFDVTIKTYPHESLFHVLQEESKKSDTDVFLVDIPWLPEMCYNNALLNLSKYVDDDFMASLDVEPMLFEEFSRYNHQVYAIPYQYCGQLLFYRKDLFENYKFRRMFYEQYKTELRCPQNWAEFNAVAKFFTREFNPESPTPYGTTLGGRYSSAACCEFLSRLSGYGGEVFDKNGRVALDTLSAIKALKNYCESYRYAPPGSEKNWWFEQIDTFAQGDAAMMIAFSSYSTGLVDRRKSKVIGKFGFTHMPSDSSLLGGWSLAINKNSSHPEEALEFIRWACNKELSIPLMLLGSQTACRRIYESEEITNLFPWIPMSLSIFSDSFKRRFPHMGKGVSMKTYEEILATAVRDCLFEKASAEDALQIAQKKMSEMMEQNEM